MNDPQELAQLTLNKQAALLEAGETSSLELTKAHLAVIDKEQPRINAMAQVFRERAVTMAERSDARRQKGATKGRFDGVPVTLKENFQVPGAVTTLGIEKYRGRVDESPAVITRLLEEQGVVILGKTNISQLMLFHESRNPVYGETKNPHDLARTPGGSSGGEAAAIAARMSPGGYGTDIGGSVRVPAHFCGIYGLKPTVDRISGRGVLSGIPGQETIRGNVGPLARSAKDLRSLMHLADPVRSSLFDPRVPPLPLEQTRKKCRIGYFVDDGFFQVSPALARAVDEARGLLEARGHTLVPFVPPLVEDLLFTYLAALSADGAETVLSQVPRKELDDALKILATLATLPNRPKKLAGRAIAALSDRAAGKTLEAVGEKSVAELWRLTARAREISSAVYDAWNLADLDAMLCPPHATVALTHKASRDFTLGGALAIRYNFLNFPAGVAPITRVSDGEELHPSREKSRLSARAKEVETNSEGMPVGVQVVARPYREDVVLQLLEELEEDSGFAC